MSQSYSEFVEGKLQHAPPTGLASIPPLAEYLFPHQRDLTTWALRRGRCAIFADTGLGKTAIELEWARHIAAHTGGDVLILAPLAVAQQTVEQWQRWASPVWTDINPSDTLQYQSAREHDDERHICPLQLEVIRRCVYLWSNPGDVVLSPFAGIGSEGVVSIANGRRFVGVELKRSYYEQSVRNLRAAMKQTSLFAADA